MIPDRVMYTTKLDLAAIRQPGWAKAREVARVALVNKWRLVFALVLVALEFSNLMQFATFGSRDLFHTASAKVNVSTYSLQALGYLMIAIVALVAPGSLRKLLAQPILRWTVVAVLVFTWGMILRAFDPPVGLSEYDVLRSFLLRLNALGFMLTCVIIFEGEAVLKAVKRAVALVTLAAVAVDICEGMHLWIFSGTKLDWNRSFGLQNDPNAAGMAIVFGCIIGLTAVPRRLREIFVVICIAGVFPTFSRESLGALVIAIVCATVGRALAKPRLVFAIAAAVLIIFTLHVDEILESQGLLSNENIERLTMQVSDRSAQDHARIAQKVWQQFENAPLLGNGFGTTAYWGDNESHNLYLSFMADHGILGVLLVPALVWCLAYRSWDYYAFAAAFLLWCMFNHNLFMNPFGLISLAIMANQRALFRESQAARLLCSPAAMYP